MRRIYACVQFVFAAKIRLFWVVKFAAKFDFESGRYLRFKFDDECLESKFGP
ncbi:hypothetical protein [Campylobacter showae]|uniref:hypothetical protein n=1 Tax=Campylobacter showae TaxID=204 RepID=UPI0013CF8149|nr:hypothetical protein [Campylobacter showae]